MARILIVDDEPDTQSLYRLEFEDAGFEVRTAASSQAALRLLATWSPDCALLDIRLGRDHGLDLLRELHARWPALPAVLLTAYAGYQDDFASWLADAYVLKSVEPHTVIERVRTVLDAADRPATLV